MLMYEDCHSLSQVPVDTDALINDCLTRVKLYCICHTFFNKRTRLSFGTIVMEYLKHEWNNYLS